MMRCYLSSTRPSHNHPLFPLKGLQTLVDIVLAATLLAILAHRGHVPGIEREGAADLLRPDEL